MVLSKATRFAAVLFPIAAIAFIVASALAVAIHWSSWLMLVAAATMLTSTVAQRRGPAASEYLTIAGAILSVASVIGMAVAL